MAIEELAEKLSADDVFIIALVDWNLMHCEDNPLKVSRSAGYMGPGVFRIHTVASIQSIYSTLFKNLVCVFMLLSTSVSPVSCGWSSGDEFSHCIVVIIILNEAVYVSNSMSLLMVRLLSMRCSLFHKIQAKRRKMGNYAYLNYARSKDIDPKAKESCKIGYFLYLQNASKSTIIIWSVTSALLVVSSALLVVSSACYLSLQGGFPANV